MSILNRKYSCRINLKVVLVIIFYFSFFPLTRAQKENISVNDPVMIKQDDTYYLFNTGWGITAWSSKDMINWKREKSVFKDPPGWAINAVPGFKGHIWAPDISYYNGSYYLYYSVSAFGKNTSCIGLAVNKTLDPDDPDFMWVDHGIIIQSVPGRDLWNAIDPNLVVLHGDDVAGQADDPFDHTLVVRRRMKHHNIPADRMVPGGDTDSGIWQLEIIGQLIGENAVAFHDGGFHRTGRNDIPIGDSRFKGGCNHYGHQDGIAPPFPKHFQLFLINIFHFFLLGCPWLSYIYQLIFHQVKC